MRQTPEPLWPLQALNDTRWLIAADEIVFADRLCADLRQAGAIVHMVDPLGLELARLHDFDAQLLLSRPGQDLRFLRDRMLSHPGLRFTSALTFSGTLTRNDGERRLEMLRLARDAYALLARDREFESLIRRPGKSVTAPVREIGLCRVLRVLSKSDDVFRLKLSAEGQIALVEMAGGLILNAVVEFRGEPKLLGAEALAAAFEIEDPEAVVEHRPSLLAPCFCEPIERALVHAFAESRERRVSSDAESPTLRMRSPFAQKRAEHDEDLVKEAPRVEPELPFLSDLTSDDDTPLPAPARTPTISGIVLQRPEGDAAPDRQTLSSGRGSLLPRLRVGHAIALAISLLVAITSTTLILKRRGAMPAPFAAPHASAKDARSRVAPPQAVAAQKEPSASSSPSQDAEPRSALVVPPTPAPEAVVEDPSALDSASVGSDEARALARKAQKALASGNIEEGLSLAERALRMRPHRLPFIVLYGDALKAAGRTDEALEYYRRAFDKKPSTPEIQERIERASNDGSGEPEQ